MYDTAEALTRKGDRYPYCTFSPTGEVAIPITLTHLYTCLGRFPTMPLTL